MFSGENDQFTDEQIVRKVIQGHEELFRIIVERYQKKIFAIGMRFYRNEDDSNDFVQDVFMKAYDNLAAFRGDSRFYSWIVKIAYNHGINSVRSRKPGGSIEDDAVPYYGPPPETVCLRNEIRDVLMKALNELPERYRICVDMYFFFNLSYGEIHEITGYPVNTIKSHVLRSKYMLRDMLRGTAAEAYHEM